MGLKCIYSVILHISPLFTAFFFLIESWLKNEKNPMKYAQHKHLNVLRGHLVSCLIIIFADDFGLKFFITAQR